MLPCSVLLILSFSFMLFVDLLQRDPSSMRLVQSMVGMQPRFVVSSMSQLGPCWLLDRNRNLCPLLSSCLRKRGSFLLSARP